MIESEVMDTLVGDEHITVEQMMDVNIGTYGQGDYVLSTGRQCEAQLITNNKLRIFDGVMVYGGVRDVIAMNNYHDVTIENGTQGMFRNDIVVRYFEKDEVEKTGKAIFKTIKGTPSDQTATDPEIIDTILRNGALDHSMKMYRVKLDGLNVVAVEPLFEKLQSAEEMKKELIDLNSKLENSNSNLSNVKNTIITKTMNLAKGSNTIGGFVIPSGRSIVAITGTMKYNNAIFSLPMPMMEYSGGAYAEYGIELIYNNGSIFATSSSAWNNVTLRVVVWY